MFPRTLAGKESKELGVVAEYLAILLGPFDAPDKHVVSASRYES